MAEQTQVRYTPKQECSYWGMWDNTLQEWRVPPFFPEKIQAKMAMRQKIYRPKGITSI